MGLRPKQRREIGAQLTLKIFSGDAAGRRHLFGDAYDPGRLVPFAPIWDGREIRAVGFAKEAIGGHDARNLTQVGRLWEGDDASKRDVEPKGEAGLGQPASAGKTVQNPAHLAPALFAKNVDGVLLGLAGVNDDGKVERTRELNLRPEHPMLDRLWREVIVVVEPDFTERARTRQTSDCRPNPRLEAGTGI